MSRFVTMTAVLSALTFIIGCDDEDNGTGANQNGASAGGSTGTTMSTGGSGGIGIGGATAGAGSVGGNGMLGTGGTSTTGGVSSTGGATALGTGGSSAVTVGGTASTGGSANAGGGGTRSACDMPICLFEMYRPCSPGVAPSGCIIQDTTVGTTRTTNACYSDGTSMSTVSDLTTFATTAKFRKDGSVCYSLESSVVVSSSGMPASSLTTYKNGAGSVVATSTFDVSTSLTSVTCTGAEPVLWDTSCGSSVDNNCQPGVCNP